MLPKKEIVCTNNNTEKKLFVLEKCSFPPPKNNVPSLMIAREENIGKVEKIQKWKSQLDTSILDFTLGFHVAP